MMSLRCCKRITYLFLSPFYSIVDTRCLWSVLLTMSIIYIYTQGLMLWVDWLNHQYDIRRDVRLDYFSEMWHFNPTGFICCSRLQISPFHVKDCKNCECCPVSQFNVANFEILLLLQVKKFINKIRMRET